MGQTYGFDRDGIRRVVGAVRLVEAGFRGSGGIAGRGAAVTIRDGHTAFFRSPAGGIASGSSATCTAQKDNGSGGLTNDTWTAAVWNNWTSSVGANKLIAATYTAGNWRVTQSDC
jgi:hypothetical protein